MCTLLDFFCFFSFSSVSSVSSVSLAVAVAAAVGVLVPVASYVSSHPKSPTPVFLRLHDLLLQVVQLSF